MLAAVHQLRLLQPLWPRHRYSECTKEVLFRRLRSLWQVEDDSPSVKAGAKRAKVAGWRKSAVEQIFAASMKLKLDHRVQYTASVYMHQFYASHVRTMCFPVPLYCTPASICALMDANAAASLSAGRLHSLLHAPEMAMTCCTTSQSRFENLKAPAPRGHVH